MPHTIAFFPTYARRIPGEQRWRTTVAGMVSRPLPLRSHRRTLAVGVLKRLLDLNATQIESEVFQRRAEAFLFQRVAGQRVQIALGGRLLDAGYTDRTGHFRADFDLDDGIIDSLSSATSPECRWIGYDAIPDDPDAFESQTAERQDTPSTGGRIQIIEPLGVSVISDIDDTVKVTNVANRRELLANTLVREFSAVPGMAEIYQRWQGRSIAFHYVSASPWQLTKCLCGFLADSGLPAGSMHLKLFRLKDSTPLGRLASRKRSKRRAVEQIMADFPERTFLLVGDSGERDPEVYAAIARRNPAQVAGIAIRQLAAKTRPEKILARLHRLAQRMPKVSLRVFTTAADLEAFFPPSTS